MDLPPPEVMAPVTLADVAAICAATDDASPLHLDEAFAQAAGYPSVVVPGTLLMGWVGQYLEEWAGGVDALERWDIRFMAPVWPGEQIKLEGRWLDSGEGEVRATTLEGKLVGLAKAAFRKNEV